jgi:hypothetical protein
MELPEGVAIVENSRVAWMATLVLRVRAVALVLGHRIYLFGATRQEFLSSRRWVLHELKHVEQYQRMGFWRFLARYGWYSLRYGYRKNPLEVEARAAEGG